MVKMAPLQNSPRWKFIIMLGFGIFTALVGGANLVNGTRNAELYNQAEGEIIRKTSGHRPETVRVKYYYKYDRVAALEYMSVDQLNDTIGLHFRTKASSSENLAALTDHYITKEQQEALGLFKGSFTIRRSQRHAYKIGDKVTVFYRKDKPWHSTQDLTLTRRLPFIMVLLGALMAGVGGYGIATPNTR